MSTEIEQPENQPCEACGCSAEVGFIIRENDDVAQVTVNGDNASSLQARFSDYLTMAKEINPAVEHEIQLEETQLTARLKFECSAEKLIFELKSRSLNNA